MKVKIKDLSYNDLCDVCHDNNCKTCPLYVRFRLFGKKECYHAARIYGEKITRRAKNKRIKINKQFNKERRAKHEKI